MYDFITHRIIQLGRRQYRVEAIDRAGAWIPVGTAPTIAQAERQVDALKRRPFIRPKAIPEDELWQDNAVRGCLSGPYMLPKGVR